MTKINLGCGDNIISGWINIDSRNLNNVDIIQRIEEVKFEPESVDEVLMKNVLEHISRTQTMPILKRIYFWLKKGGSLIISVPDMELCARQILTHSNLKQTFIKIYGNQGYKEDTHLTGFTRNTIKQFLENVGFKTEFIENNPKFKIEDIVIKGVK